MEVIESISEMKNLVKEWKRQGLSIGFVPTMGYLHEGHLALVRRVKELSDRVVVSIFVNPIQFAPGEDYQRYPRDLERDKALLEKEGVDVLFSPKAQEMYPPGFQTYVEVKELSSGLCGRYRTGHFVGVATVVLKLFNIVQPDIAVFGEKDYQQLKVIQRMVQDLNLDVKIISHPTVREEDGLAMSSRNTYLSPEERKSAIALYKALNLAEELINQGERRVATLKEKLKEFIESYPYTKVQYIEFVHPETLKEVERVDEPTLLALAVFVGKARLIDNKIIIPKS
ncbi:MAG: pantoate--beta-alanine ligase [Thermodesulfobacterium sp.]|jgi:pantoate--beta-alanine ligase|nr:pantoate--beta-alanine ligase [Thermodesulfobacterium sp.]